MKFINESGLPAQWTMGFRRDGRELLVVVVKATYTLPERGADAMLAERQMPLVEADRFTGDPGRSAPLHETDFAHDKPACDVLLVGSAHAGVGRRATQLEVGLQVGAMHKRFRVIGHRRWRRHAVLASASTPEPFESLPISYDVAYGGTGALDAAGRAETFEANPVGRGFVRDPARANGLALPNTERIGERIEAPGKDYAPQAFGPLGRNWLPRRRLAGTYDQAWLESTAPLWPQDFDERYFQAAPPDQQIAHPHGGEPVVLRYLTPDVHRAFALPRRRMPILFIPHRGRDLVQAARLDTLVFEPDAGLFTMAWRVALPLGRSVFDVRETVVGERTPAWHRARATPGKRYYQHLADAVRVRQGRGGSP